MRVWKLTEADYDRLMASERHHFLHLNATSVCSDCTVNMAFSPIVARMLKQELGIDAVPIFAPTKEGELSHPDDSYVLDDDDLRRVALNAPGFN